MTTSLKQSKRRTASFNPKLGLWGLQLTALGSLLLWLLLDGYLAQLTLRLTASVQNGQLSSQQAWPRIVGLSLLSLAFWIGWIVGIAALLAGWIRQAGIKYIVGLTTSMALWLAILSNWNAIVEAGQSWRFRSERQQIRKFAAEIDQQWKALCRDPDQKLLPEFNAYPLYEPTLLIFLGHHTIPGTDIAYNAIERSESHTVRFELTGSNSGWWLEVHTDQLPPTNFIGGLEESFSVMRARPISDSVFLVHYDVQ